MKLVHALFQSQESSYEVHAAFVQCRANRTKTFNPVGCLVMLVHASFSTSKDAESSSRHCGGPVKLVQYSFSARKDLESSFRSGGSPVKLVHALFQCQERS